MATPMNMDKGRHAFRAPQISTGQRQRPVTGVKVTVKLYGDETPEQRRTRHALATGVSRGAWK